MNIVSNLGARKVCQLPRNFNVHECLQTIRSQFEIDVEFFYVQTVVNWLGHCFRHSLQPIFSLLSLPLDGRLAGLRSAGPQTLISDTSVANWLALFDAGLEVVFPSSGRLGVRGASGHAFRWGEGWFGPTRDGGVGWSFERSDIPEAHKRVRILLKLFQRNSRSTLALEDASSVLSV